MRPFKNWNAKHIEQLLEDPYARGVDGRDVEAVYGIDPFPGLTRVESIHLHARMELSHRKNRQFEHDFSRNERLLHAHALKRIGELKERLTTTGFEDLKQTYGTHCEIELGWRVVEDEIEASRLPPAPF